MAVWLFVAVATVARVARIADFIRQAGRVVGAKDKEWCFASAVILHHKINAIHRLREPLPLDPEGLIP